MAVAPNFTNRTMWTRDNLDILRGLNDGCIDLVYADPPFNSNKNYEFTGRAHRKAEGTADTGGIAAPTTNPTRARSRRDE